jgi:hypothetical protein
MVEILRYDLAVFVELQSMLLSQTTMRWFDAIARIGSGFQGVAGRGKMKPATRAGRHGRPELQSGAEWSAL